MRDSRLARLSPREREIALLVAQGLTNKEISEQIFLGISTIKHYVMTASRKMEAQNRTQMAAMVWFELTTPDPDTLQ